ncbi:hypothetical protein GCM10007079_11920 [Nocardiopsis terrae]|uniref:Uncharacterized protein n=1 Tax=Nocardiopsis terrae TaxID=372655 RepID=A0ABR9HC39_9ACTN|nr:hypothetical protein [Nocardiopsis terrae]MBE1456597.1 hypothetical protein [Nocardiopsis terrae]GHC76023.1 hypothetical protein GCM10007079_11920 [Nocardiopsis terrae]
MDSQLGDTVRESLPGRVREDLRDVDRLREVWAEQRHNQPPDARGAARRALTHARVLEWGGDSALTDLLLTGADVSGDPMTGPRVAALAERVAELPEGYALRPLRTTLPDEYTLELSRAAAAPAHPVVRAAHTYAECVRILAEASGEEPDGAGPPWVLPWVLASHVLQRADLPPLLLDPRTPPPGTGSGQDPAERLAVLTAHFARLVTGALRGELGWHPGAVPTAGTPVPPLAAVTRRRILEYVRSRRGPVALILRALDPRASATVSSGDEGGPMGARGSRATDRLLFTPGAAHWWTCLELVAGEASLSLYVVVQDVGSPPSGVLAVTANARLVTSEGVRETLEMSGTDSVTVMPTDCVDDRWPQVRDLVDEAVSRSMNELTRV